MSTDREVPLALGIAMFTDTYAPQMNGVARTLTRWEQALRRRGHRVRIFTTTFPGTRSTTDVTRFDSVPFWGYRELRLAAPSGGRVARELQEFAPDLVHVATPFGVGLAGRAAALRLGIPLVTSYHTSLAEYAHYYGLGAASGIGMSYLRWFHNSGLRTFVPTRVIADQLRDRGFERLALWSRGVDAVRFHPGHRDAGMRARMGAGRDGFVVGYVGRVAAEKGVGVLSRAVAEVVRQCPGTAFAVAGDGPALSECRRLTPANSWFAGRLTGRALSQFYASLDLFVFPSATDTFGNVLLEAMASGVPVVAADVPQAREVLGSAAARYFPPGDSESLARVVRELVVSPLALHEMRQAALRRARAASWHAVFEQLLADYRVTLAARRPASLAGRADALQVGLSDHVA